MEIGRGLRPPSDGGGRASAVLILFGEGAQGPDLLLIQRSSTLRNHAGQPAFPGGALDPEDGDPAGDGPVNAALREAHEETGLDPSGVDVLATLPDLFVWRSGFRVTPVVAWWRAPSEVGPGDPAEVASVARVPVRDLADPANRASVRAPGGYVGPVFLVADMMVWGFTGGIVDALLEAGGWARPWDHQRVVELPRAAYGRPA
jgi:8-oxo-dGTP pyrophosphatase MutT (NUDIX family)